MSYHYPESGGAWQDSGSGWSGGSPGYGPYGGTGGGYGPPPPPPPYTDPYAAPPDKTSTIWALVVSILSVVLCCYTNIIGIVFAAIALSKDREPEEMERMTRWSWISTGIHVAVGVVLVVLWLIFVVWMESQATYY
jgi:hypothetical protein